MGTVSEKVRTPESTTLPETQVDLPQLPEGVTIPDDISGLRARRPATGIRWMRWMAFMFLLVVGMVAAGLVLRSDSPDELTETPTGEVEFRAMEPAWQPNLELLEQYLDPVGAEFRAMEPVGRPDYEMLYSIFGAPSADPVGVEFRAMEPAWQPNSGLLEQYLDPVGAEFRAMEPVGKPDYEMLYSIIGAPYAEPVAGPR